MRIRKPGITKEYVLREDRESATPTVFTLRQLTWEENAKLHELSPMSTETALQVHAITSKAMADGRELTDDEAHEINRLQKVDAEFINKLNRQMAQAVRFGVVEIRDLYDMDGHPLHVSVNDFVTQADPATLRELGEEIIRFTRLTEDTAKK